MKIQGASSALLSSTTILVKEGKDEVSHSEPAMPVINQ